METITKLHQNARHVGYRIRDAGVDRSVYFPGAVSVPGTPPLDVHRRELERNKFGIAAPGPVVEPPPQPFRGRQLMKLLQFGEQAGIPKPPTLADVVALQKERGQR